MEGICPKCGTKELVHTFGFRRGEKCSNCGTKLEPTEKARRIMASRSKEEEPIFSILDKTHDQKPNKG